MPSPAKASFQRKLAQIASGETAREGSAAPMPTEGPVASEYQQLLAALQIDMNRLRQIESTGKKIEAKRDMIGTYRAWVEGALASETPAQDEIVANMLVWAMDVCDWDLAFRLATHVVTNDLALPERYKRKPVTLIVEEVAEAGLAPEPRISRNQMQLFAEAFGRADMHDQVKAKLAKALGLAFKREGDAFDASADNAMAGGKMGLFSEALDHFQTALALDKSCGVKKMIEGLERDLKKAAPSEQAAAT